MVYENYILSEVHLSEQLKISQTSNFKASIPEFLKHFAFRTPLYFLKVIEDPQSFCLCETELSMSFVLEIKTKF